jgi:hypothetical protein
MDETRAKPRAEADGASARQYLLVTVERLPKPHRSDFRNAAPPPDNELESYRVVEDKPLRQQILSAGLGELVQRSGPGNFQKTKPPANIMKIYPNFDAPATAPKPRQRVERAPSMDSTMSTAVIHDLRTKWERYYLDTRPDRQRVHAERAESADPSVISDRAKQLIAEARRAGKTMTTRDAMLQATDEITADFETLMRRRYGDIVVDIFGIPEA